MKKYIVRMVVILLVMGNVFSFVSCGIKKNPTPNTSNTNSSEGSISNVNSNISSVSSLPNNLSQSSSKGSDTINQSTNNSKLNNSSSSSVSSTTNSSKDNVDNRDFNFNGVISKDVLNNYLSKGLTFNGLASWAGYGSVPAGPDPDFEDDFRMIKSLGAMFIGRAAHVWGSINEEEHFADAKRIARRIHDYNSKIILEAAVFEAVYKNNVNAIPIPSWVFEAFSLPVVNRNFSYNDMLFTDGAYLNQWGTDGSVPDLTRIETQMWFYYRCCRYIDSGYEALHLGQLILMSRYDPTKKIRYDLFQKIRDYAKIHAPRKLVLLSAHIYSSADTTYSKNGKTYLLLDYHTYPLRPKDNFSGNKTQSDGFQPVMLEKNFADSIYGRSAGGINPNGWTTDANPFVVEFDNSGYDPKTKDTNLGAVWPWGYDEITWFAKQPEKRRAEVLKYFYNWINDNYQYGNILFPARVPLAFPFNVTYNSQEFGNPVFNNILIFKANTQSPASITSFNLESTMKSLWEFPR